jgi:hypothetical protein
MVSSLPSRSNHRTVSKPSRWRDLVTHNLRRDDYLGVVQDSTPESPTYHERAARRSMNREMVDRQHTTSFWGSLPNSSDPRPSARTAEQDALLKKIFTAGQGDWRNPKSRAQKDSPHGVRAIRSDPRLNYPRSLLGFSNLGRDCARNRQRSKHRFALLQGGTRRTQPLLSPFDDPDGRDLQNNEPRSAPPRRTGGAYSQLIATWLPGGSV